MFRREPLDIAQTNLANFGSDLETKIKKAAAEGEEAWTGCSAPLTDNEEVRVTSWRIEQFRVVAWTGGGSFFDGDSYVVLRTFKEGNRTRQFVHFWLGKYTSQDEAGTAAYKAVELDDFLGGTAVQFREVQGAESKEFLSCFPGEDPFSVQAGGVASGFRSVEADTFEPRMFEVCKAAGGKVRVQEVPPVKGSLTPGNVYLYDTEQVVYQWNGSSCSVFEKSAASDFASRIINLEPNRADAKHVVVDEGEGETEQALLALIPEGEGRPSTAGAAPLKLLGVHRLSDGSGEELTLTPSEGTTLAEADPTDVYFVDGASALYVWIGAGASQQERRLGQDYARRYLLSKDRIGVPTVVCTQGGEPETLLKLW